MPNFISYLFINMYGKYEYLVDQRGTEMGEEAWKLLFEIINKKQPPQTKVVKANLILRDSTK